MYNQTEEDEAITAILDNETHEDLHSSILVESHRFVIQWIFINNFGFAFSTSIKYKEKKEKLQLL